MNTKKLMVSMCTIAIALFLVATVSATTCTSCGCAPYLTPSEDSDLAACYMVEVDGINVLENPSVIADETVSVKVTFTVGDLNPVLIPKVVDGVPVVPTVLVDDGIIDGSASNVRVKVELEGDKSVEATTAYFDVEAGRTYTKTLSLKVPFELKDSLSEDMTLNVRIWNGDFETETSEYVLGVQRPSYNPVVKSISTAQSVNAGETFPVDVILKNLGYNDLEDVYVIASIPALGVEKTAYFGDLVTIESCTEDCDEEDTVSGRIFLEVPYTAKAGIYALEVKVTNDDVTAKFAKQLVIGNDVAENVIVMNSGKTVAVGEDAEYSLLLLNPTNSLKVYKIVTESNGDLSTSVDSTVVAIPAGSSKTVTVTASSKTEGEYTFNVNVLSGEQAVNQVALSLKVEGKTVNPIVVLTVVLAIIFLVLLVVLIVLIGRKPQKTEEYGESYY